MTGPSRVPLSRALAVLAVGAAAWLVLVPAPAQAACTCAPGGVRVHAQQADAVFSGLVVDARLDTVGTGDRERKIRRQSVEVDRIYQGNVSESPVVVTSAARTADCGLPRVPAEQPWVFFVEGGGTTFSGDRCGGSRPATDTYLRTVEDALGAGRVLVEPVAEPPPLEFTPVDTSVPSPLGRLVAPGAAVALIGVLGLALVRRRASSGR